jgi:hypothetical protein
MSGKAHDRMTVAPRTGGMVSRRSWTELSDALLLGQCQVDTYRANGPGGQKRNKTSSAVRLRHLPSGIMAIAEESRSQHDNRLRALRRLRQALHLQIREPLRSVDLTIESLQGRPEYSGARGSDGRLSLSKKNPRFWPVAALILDVLQAVEARVSDAAARLGISTGNLIDFLQVDGKVWQQANRLRGQFGQKPLIS